MFRKAAVLFLTLTLLLPAAASAEVLVVDGNTPLHESSPLLYGLFFEDINHAADGGLYAELLQNRSFEYEELLAPAVHQHLTGWAFNTSAGADGRVAVSGEEPMNENNPTYLRITAEEGYTFQNLGWGETAFRGGISLKAGEQYDFSLFLRQPEGLSPGTEAPRLAVYLSTKAGEPLSGETVVSAGDAWGKRESVLRAEADSEAACLTFRLIGSEALDIDMASLMPKDRLGADWPGGGLRRDLAEALRELKPRFLRFPGGCVAEGSWKWSNLYRWKDTVGPAEERKENWNTWGYMQSYGIGFYEYFCLCEEIGALPLPVVGSGVLCQAREPAESPMMDEELRAWTLDILDLIEFAAGEADTVWGSLRAEMGHPEPFDLRFIAIGNENWGNIYFDRYEKIRQAVKEKYPEITCIVANGPVAEGSLYYSGRRAILSRFPEDVIDEHYYMESSWFLKNTHRYDLYPRETKIFLGEYAAHESAAGGRRPNNLYSALCEAAYLTGIERNSDLVIMSCYAPLLARTGMDQWMPDLIWFNGSQVLRTPNYYVQKMFSESSGDEVISSFWQETGEAFSGEKEGIYQVAVRREDGTAFVKLVNVSGAGKTVRLEDPSGNPLTGQVTLLAGEKQAQNSYTNESLHPQTEEFMGEINLPGYAAAVIKTQQQSGDKRRQSGTEEPSPCLPIRDRRTVPLSLSSPCLSAVISLFYPRQSDIRCI